MFVVKHKTIFFIISTLFVATSLGALVVWGLPLGIDFTGGTILEVTYVTEAPSREDFGAVLDPAWNASVRPAGEDGFIIRTTFLAEDEQEELLEAVGFGDSEYTIERLSSVGPTIGEELRRKALIAIALVVALIILYIAFVFRKVSDPVSSWKYGVAAIVALIHDILIPTGVIVVLGQFSDATADSLFVMALLAILGLSVNDTIVVFDRIRERLQTNSHTHNREPFVETVGKGLEQTYIRSINTSLTTLLVLLTLFFIGGPTIHNFVLTLIVGTIAGTYSSIFLASPLLVAMAGQKD